MSAKMLILTQPITLDRAAIESPNLCDRFLPEDLDRIGIACAEGLERDQQSRRDWMKRNEAGMDLALQVQKDKSFPWQGCANVAFPLVTIAAQQFHARAYPALINGNDVVNVKVFAPDPEGQRRARGDRIAAHMNWQLLYEDRCWEEQEDKAILNVSIVGTNFKKSYYSAAEGHNVSELVLARDLVLNYWTKSIEKCPRKTHMLRFFRNEVHEKVMTGVWRDILDEAWYKDTPPQASNHAQQRQDNRQGVVPPQPDEDTSLSFPEQHCDLDLDGDGYAEPYIITFSETSKKVVRIVTRFDDEKDIVRVQVGKNKGKIIRINAMEYFTKKTFIPSPDGGIYDIGFGVFLGPLNEAVNSCVNMLLDCGTMQTTAGGFLARGAKIRGGNYTFSPFEWKRVDSTGDDIRKSLIQLPVNAPSDVLFKLLGLLIDYTSRVAGTTDITMGENPGQNTPAQTAQTMVEMGQKIYNAIFKRLWRSAKGEFQKLYKLNSLFLKPDVEYVGGATLADYAGNGDDLFPVADPNVTSETMRVQQAMALKSSAMTTPGYNKDAVERRFLTALRVDNPQEVFPGSQGQPQPEDPKLQIAKLQEQGETQRLQMQLQADREQFAIELMEERSLNSAKILELMAKAEAEKANAQSEMAYAAVAAVNAEVGRLKIRNETLDKRIGHLLEAMKFKTEIALRKEELAIASRKAAA